MEPVHAIGADQSVIEEEDHPPPLAATFFNSA